MAARILALGSFSMRSSVPLMYPIGTRRTKAPRCAFCRIAACARSRKLATSISLMVPFMPNNNRSLVSLGSYTASASIRRTPMMLQNSSSVCHSRFVRASRDASMLKTAPTCLSHTAANRRSKPGRWIPDPEIPRSSSMTSISCQPRVRARSTRPYWRRLLSRLCRTCSGVDWRMYTQARRAR